jgi:hypothetical protein
MADIDLRAMPENEIVFHFGGRANEVDAFTFSNSLIAFGEAIQEISRQLNPELRISVTIDGVGPGSFRARIKTTTNFLGGLFKTHAKEMVIGVLSGIIVDMAMTSHDTIIINDSEVIIERGSDKIIVPRTVYDARQKLTDQRRVENHISRAFGVMENDPSVTDFGILGHLSADFPIAIIPRESFPRISLIEVDEDPKDGLRHKDYRAVLTIVKAIFQRGNRKWEFVWQGNKISAPIRDEAFFGKLASREIWFAQGDEIDSTLRVHQTLDDINNVFVNQSYEVIEVFDVKHKSRQTKFPD